MLTAKFYNQLTPFYHFVYPDWEASITNQAAALHSLITEVWGEESRLSSMLRVVLVRRRSVWHSWGTP